MAQEKVEQRIVSAAGIATLGQTSGDRKRFAAARAMQEVMTQAVVDCEKEGITDPDKIQARMMEYRDRFKGIVAKTVEAFNQDK